jgi:hypothetical protein
MNQLPLINMIGGKKKPISHHIKQATHHINKIAKKVSQHTSKHLADHTIEYVDPITSVNMTMHVGFFGRIYDLLVKIGDEFWLGIVSGFVILLLKHILYDIYNSNIDIKNVTNSIENNDEYNENLVKQKKLLYYIKDKFKWAELVSSTGITIFAAFFSRFIVHTLGNYGVNFDYILILITLVISWYSGFLSIIYKFINDFINDKNKNIDTNHKKTDNK